MKKRWIAAAALVLSGAVAVPLLKANHLGHESGMMSMGGGMGMRHLRALKEKLDLSDAQVDQLKAIAAEVREANKPYRETMRGDFKSVATLLLANPNDLSKAESILDQNDAARKQMRENILRGVSKGLNVLTPEQRTKLGELIAQHAGRFER